MTGMLLVFASVREDFTNTSKCVDNAQTGPDWALHSIVYLQVSDHLRTYHDSPFITFFAPHEVGGHTINHHCINSINQNLIKLKLIELKLIKLRLLDNCSSKITVPKQLLLQIVPSLANFAF